MRKALFVFLFVLAAVAVAIGGYYRYGRNTEEPRVATLPVTRGDVAESVGATGTLEAVTTVQVGTQVSGTIKALYADFNSIVRRGQLVAELDPSLFETQVAQGQANLTRAQADVQRLRVALEDAENKLKRTRDLAARNLVPAMELETAETTVHSAQAQLRSSEAQVVQAQASLNQSQVNLQHTVIAAPIDGIVISRNVDVGQTVAASMQAPTLFVIAADLTKMRVIADIDESDVGRIRPGQMARFRVDAHALEEFTGTVTQIRLQPKVVQNVVTYATVIDVPNPTLKLKPGMTATVTVEIARRTDVLRVPVAALRFRPSTDMFVALQQEVPPEMQRGGPNAGGGARPGGEAAPEAATTTGAPAPAAAAAAGAVPPAGGPAAPAGERRGPPAAPAEGGRVNGNQGGGPQGGATPRDEAAQGGGGTPGGGPPGDAPRADAGQGAGRGGGDPEERRRRMQERMQSMSPEEREQFLQRMRERGVDPQGGAQGGPRQPGGGPGQGGAPGLANAPGPDTAAGPGRPAGQGQAPGAAAAGTRRAQAAGPASPAVAPRGVTASRAQTIDSLFGPLPSTATSGRVWLFVNGQLKPIRVRLGISDGTYTELLSGDGLEHGTEVVSTLTLPAQAASGAQGRSPLMGPTRGGPPGGGGGARPSTGR